MGIIISSLHTPLLQESECIRVTAFEVLHNLEHDGAFNWQAHNSCVVVQDVSVPFVCEGQAMQITHIFHEDNVSVSVDSTVEVQCHKTDHIRENIHVIWGVIQRLGTCSHFSILTVAQEVLNCRQAASSHMCADSACALSQLSDVPAHRACFSRHTLRAWSVCAVYILAGSYGQAAILVKAAWYAVVNKLCNRYRTYPFPQDPPPVQRALLENMSPLQVLAQFVTVCVFLSPRVRNEQLDLKNLRISSGHVETVAVSLNCVLLGECFSIRYHSSSLLGKRLGAR